MKTPFLRYENAVFGVLIDSDISVIDSDISVIDSDISVIDSFGL